MIVVVVDWLVMLKRSYKNDDYGISVWCGGIDSDGDLCKCSLFISIIITTMIIGKWNPKQQTQEWREI